jgi:hypothetical protein
VLIAALGFLFSKLYERLEALTVLEYSLERHGNVTIYTFKNLSRVEKIKNAQFIIFSTDVYLTVLKPQYIPPAVPSTNPAPPGEDNPHSRIFSLEELNPTNSINLTVEVDSHPESLQLRFKSDGAVIVMPRGFETFVVDNEFTILGGLILVLIAVAVTYALMLSLHPIMQDAQEAKTQ